MAPPQKTLALELGTLSFILRTQVGGTEKDSYRSSSGRHMHTMALMRPHKYTSPQAHPCCRYR